MEAVTKTKTKIHDFSSTRLKLWLKVAAATKTKTKTQDFWSTRLSLKLKLNSQLKKHWRTSHIEFVP